MEYFVISEGDTPKAVIAHEYSTQLFNVRTKSQYLSNALECCLNSVTGADLYKDGSLVKVVEFDESNPFFIKNILSKLTRSDFWRISSKGNLVDIIEFEEIVSELL